MLITKRSDFTGKENTMDLDITEEQLIMFKLGMAHIQTIFPGLTADEREFLKTGVTAEEWAENMPPEE